MRSCHKRRQHRDGHGTPPSIMLHTWVSTPKRCALAGHRDTHVLHNTQYTEKKPRARSSCCSQCLLGRARNGARPHSSRQGNHVATKRARRLVHATAAHNLELSKTVLDCLHKSQWPMARCQVHPAKQAANKNTSGLPKHPEPWRRRRRRRGGGPSFRKLAARRATP